MGALVLNPTSTAQWHSLIHEASQATGISLDEELESYLVFLLMRFVDCTELASSVIATEHLSGLNAEGCQKKQILRDVGDKCLLFSGFFPGIAEKRLVRISYFVRLGRSAYGVLSNHHQDLSKELFSSLSEKFISLMDVLQSAQSLADNYALLSPLQAAELWTDTRSCFASKTLSESFEGVFVPEGDPRIKH